MRKKVVLLATYLGVVNRGAETYVIELVKKLRSVYDIEVYAMGTNSQISEQIIQVPIQFSKILSWHEKFYYQSRLYQKICDRTYYFIPSVLEQYFFSQTVYKKYLASRSDIDLLFPVNGIWGVKIAEKIRRQNGTPFIYAGHGGIGRGEELILKCDPDAYIALTPWALKWASKISNKTLLIPNGVDLAHFNRKIPIQKDSLNVLCVGAFTTFKRQKLLIDAMKLVNHGTLTLLGSGELQEDIEVYGKKHLGDRFVLCNVPYDQVKDYYEKANVFSLPSLNEPFGIVYVEAMAMNLPIVAPDDEARRYVIGDCGILCDVENASQYAEALQKCLETDFSDRPVQRVAENFSWDVIANAYIRIFNKVMNK